MKEQSPTKFNKLLIVAQYWAGDLLQMQELLKLVADLEPGFNEKADFLIFPRVDTNTREFKIAPHLSQKFNVSDSRSTRQDRGWPFGPNGVAMDAFKHTHELFKAGKFGYDAAMLMESDCVPLRKGWIGELLDEWNGQQGLFLGHWDGDETSRAPASHMNGNLLFHPEAFDLIPEMAYGPTPRPGWDMFFWHRMRHFGTPSRLIFSDYRLNTRSNPLGDCSMLWKGRVHTHPNNPLYNELLTPCWLHGTKGFEPIECVRKKLC